MRDPFRIIPEADRVRKHVGFLAVSVSDEFKGFSEASVDCLILLKGLTGLTEIERKRLKYGCTCGRCIEGCLSPRMLNSLISWLEGDCELYRSDKDWKEYCETSNGAETRILPFRFVACLEKDILPTLIRVKDTIALADEWWPDLKKTIRYSQVQSYGSRLFTAMMEDDALAGFSVGSPQSLDDLPTCRNDHEFGFASGMCGYDRVSPHVEPSECSVM